MPFWFYKLGLNIKVITSYFLHYNKIIFIGIILIIIHLPQESVQLQSSMSHGVLDIQNPLSTSINCFIVYICFRILNINSVIFLRNMYFAKHYYIWQQFFFFFFTLIEKFSCNVRIYLYIVFFFYLCHDNYYKSIFLPYCPLLTNVHLNYDINLITLNKYRLSPFIRIFI